MGKLWGRGSNKITKRNSPRKEVLSDHKKVGKILIPPFVASLGVTMDASWLNRILPELLCIAFLHEFYDLKKASGIAIRLNSALGEVFNKLSAIPTGNETPSFCSISSLEALEETQIPSSLKAEIPDDYEDASQALKPLLVCHPDCPLKFVFPAELQPIDDYSLEESVGILRGVVEKALVRTRNEPNCIQATAIYILIQSGSLCITEEMMYEIDLNELVMNPSSDLSQETASRVRAMLNAYYGLQMNKRWPKLFWNRNLEISRCR